MQSAGGGGGGSGRVGPVGRAASTSAAASPTSSSSAVSKPQLGFDSVQHDQLQQQQQQQLASRQALQLQQQLLRKPEGNENLLAYQAGAFQGLMGEGNFPGSMQVPQRARKILDLVQQHGSSQEGQNRGQGMDQQIPNPVHQAYIQFALQASQQKSALAMQSQKQAEMGVLGPSAGKDQDM